MPAAAEKFRAFSVGWNHACAIRENGTLACWGSNINGQSSPPTGTFVQVAAGNTFTCGIRSDGTRTCWGSDAAGQAPQLALSPGVLPPGLVGGAYTGAQFTVGDGAPDAGGHYVPPTPAFVVTVGTLPDGLTLSAAGALSGSPTAAGRFPFTVEAEDANGFTVSREYSMTITTDDTPPVIAYTLAPPTPDGDNGWYVGDVGVAWSVTDGQSAINGSTGCTAATLSSDTLGASFTCSATSAGGSNSVTTPSLKRDATPPSIVAAATTAPNANGWYTGDVTVHFSCADATSGLADACPADEVLTGEGASISSTVATIHDNAGNSATSNVVSVDIDRSAPVISYSLSPVAPNGANGWYTGDVLVHWTVADPQSGIASSTGCADATLSSDGFGASYACSATNGAGAIASATTDTIKRDATKPTISAALTSVTDGNNGWYRSNAAVHFTCADATSGIASCPADQTLSTEGSAVSSSARTATDNAGNSSDPSNIVTVKIDKTAPTLAPTVPDPILRDGSYSASPNASDAVSGVASASCGALDTSSLGSFSTICSAADYAGNSRTVTLDYTVTTTCVNDGYTGAKLTWCQNICENGLTGAVLDTWIHRWIQRYRTLPYCRVEPD